MNYSRMNLKDITIGTIQFSSLSEDEIVEFVDYTIQNKGKATIAYANAHVVIESEKNKDLRKNINAFTLIKPDGIGVYYASKILTHNQESFKLLKNATDFNYRLLDYSDKHGRNIYLLGSTDDVLTAAKKYIKTHFPNIKIVGSHNGYFNLSDAAIAENINSSNVDILLVGMGVPRQELWLQGHVKELSVPVSITVGAFIEFISQRKRRAPNTMRKFGLEWLFRLLQEPCRLWKRYVIGIPYFIFVVFKQKYIKL